MKAAYISEHGDLDKSVHGDRPEPEVAPGEVMLRVRGNALNPIVTVERRADRLMWLTGHNQRSSIGIEKLLVVSTEPEVYGGG